MITAPILFLILTVVFFILAGLQVARSKVSFEWFAFASFVLAILFGMRA